MPPAMGWIRPSQPSGPAWSVICDTRPERGTKQEGRKGKTHLLDVKRMCTGAVADSDLASVFVLLYRERDGLEVCELVGTFVCYLAD